MPSLPPILSRMMPGLPRNEALVRFGALAGSMVVVMVVAHHHLRVSLGRMTPPYPSTSPPAVAIHMHNHQATSFMHVRRCVSSIHRTGPHRPIAIYLDGRASSEEESTMVGEDGKIRSIREMVGEMQGWHNVQVYPMEEVLRQHLGPSTLKRVESSVDDPNTLLWPLVLRDAINRFGSAVFLTPNYAFVEGGLQFIEQSLRQHGHFLSSAGSKEEAATGRDDGSPPPPPRCRRAIQAYRQGSPAERWILGTAYNDVISQAETGQVPRDEAKKGDPTHGGPRLGRTLPMHLIRMYQAYGGSGGRALCSPYDPVRPLTPSTNLAPDFQEIYHPVLRSASSIGELFGRWASGDQAPPPPPPAAANAELPNSAHPDPSPSLPPVAGRVTELESILIPPSSPLPPQEEQGKKGHEHLSATSALSAFGLGHLYETWSMSERYRQADRRIGLSVLLGGVAPGGARAGMAEGGGGAAQVIKSFAQFWKSFAESIEHTDFPTGYAILLGYSPDEVPPEDGEEAPYGSPSNNDNEHPRATSGSAAERFLASMVGRALEEHPPPAIHGVKFLSIALPYPHLHTRTVASYNLMFDSYPQSEELDSVDFTCTLSVYSLLRHTQWTKRLREAFKELQMGSFYPGVVVPGSDPLALTTCVHRATHGELFVSLFPTTLTITPSDGSAIIDSIPVLHSGLPGSRWMKGIWEDVPRQLASVSISPPASVGSATRMGPFITTLPRSVMEVVPMEGEGAGERPHAVGFAADTDVETEVRLHSSRVAREVMEWSVQLQK